MSSSTVIGLHIIKHSFNNHRGPQCEFIIRLDNLTLTTMNTVDESISIQECAARVDVYVRNLRRKLNMFVAVGVSRENIVKVAG